VVTLSMLWAPILLASGLVFVASSLLWTVLQFHRDDFRALPDEEAVADALRRQAVGPGQYVIPYVADRKRMQDPDFVKRMEQGPVGFLTLAKPGPARMGKNLTLWLLYVLGVSVFVAYLASRTLPAGSEYLEVFRVVGTTAILAYSAGVLPGAIWFARPWRSVWKEALDGVIYGLLTAGTFGWLWPR
jgi:hypothetical protein